MSTAQLIPYPSFIGATYAARSKTAANERTINMYPEIVEARSGKNIINLYRKPGLQLFCTLPTGPVQAMYELNGRSWALSGNTVYELFANGTFAARGTVTAPSAGTYAGMVANSANQVFVVSPPNGFILDISANTLTEITSSGFLGAQTGTMMDGYFVANQGGTAAFSVSNQQDGLTWSGLNQQSTQDYPDNLVAVDNLVHYLALFGQNRSEVYYNTGSNSTIFARYEGSYQYQGLAAPWSRAYLDNTIFYLGRSFTGTGVVFKLEDFTPKRISDHSLENAIQDYPTVDDAVAYAYEEDGHFFYVIHFPSANPTLNGPLGATWVYDVTTEKWCERGFYDTTIGAYRAEIGRFHAFAFDMHLVGSYLNGKIYQQSLDFPTDDGASIRWMRQAPHLYDSNVRIFYHQLILDMQVGSAPASGQGSDPKISMQYSDDGGNTWSFEVTQGIGKLGEFRKRVTFNRCGFARDRIFRIFGTDPTPALCLVNAYLLMTPGTS